MAVLVWVVWAVSVMPVQPPIAAANVIPMRHPRRARVREFLGECCFWACCVFYGLVVGSVVAAVFVLVWLWLVQ